MRFYAIFLLSLSLLAVFEAKPFTLRDVKPKLMDGEEFSELWRGLHEWLGQKINVEDLKKGLIHLIKAFGDKEILITWYSLPKSERECINKAQVELFTEISSGKQYTPEEALNFIKESCPNSCYQIQILYDLKIEKLKELIKKVSEKVKKLPKSVQDAIKKLYQGLKKIGFEKDEEKLRAALLPFFEQLLEIPDEDLQKFAELCPDMAPILTGDLKKYACIIIRSFIKYCKTGNHDAFDEEFFRAVGKFIPYLQEKFEKLCEYIKHAPEQDLPDFVNKGIEEEINKAFDQIDSLNDKDRVENNTLVDNETFMQLMS